MPAAELTQIEGFDEEIVEELRNRARDVLLTKAIAKAEHAGDVKPSDDLMAVEGMDTDLAQKLAEKGVMTRDDLADLATDELVQKKRPEQRRQRERSERAEDKGGVLADYGLSEEQGNEIIMAARAHWFEDEAAPAQTEEAADADSPQ